MGLRERTIYCGYGCIYYQIMLAGGLSAWKGEKDTCNASQVRSVSVGGLTSNVDDRTRPGNPCKRPKMKSGCKKIEIKQTGHFLFF